MSKPYEAYGHKDLSVSDFGWWHCRVCGQRGDDWTHPKDFECVALDDYYEI